MPSLNGDSQIFPNFPGSPRDKATASPGWSVWWLAFRPKTLTAAVVPVFVATGLAFRLDSRPSLAIAALALLSALFIQVGTNLFNDVLDFLKGADTHDRVGPVRATQKGLLSPQRVMRGGYLCFLLAIFFGLPLVVVGGLPIFIIGLMSLLMGYVYTGGPFPLAYRGLGDFFVLLFFGWVAVGGMYYIHTGSFSWPVFLAGTQVGLLATVLIAINNFRDHQQDRAAGKMTLAARFGPKFAKIEIITLLILTYGLQIFWFDLGYPLVALAPLLTLPPALRIARGIWQIAPGPAVNRFLSLSGLVHFLFGVLLTLGLCFK